MAMMRRNFIEAGIGGVAALSVAQGVARAQSPGGGQGVTVVGVDGSGLTPSVRPRLFECWRQRVALLRKYHRF